MTAKRVSQKVPESGVLRACLDLLAAEKIWHRRWNGGAVKIGSRFLRFGKPGDGDILAIPVVRYQCICCSSGHTVTALHPLWIECKSDSGKQSEDQKNFQEECRERSHTYLLVRDVDTLRNWIRKHCEAQ